MQRHQTLSGSLKEQVTKQVSYILAYSADLFKVECNQRRLQGEETIVNLNNNGIADYQQGVFQIAFQGVAFTGRMLNICISCIIS